jgi:hypothetical protein
MAVIAEMENHCVLIAGDAAYDEQTLLSRSVDGVAQSAALHHDSTRRLRELCRRRPTVTQFAHAPESAKRLASAAVTRAD